MRLGLRYVKGLREAMGKCIEEERRRVPFASAADLVKRTEVRRDELTQLARIGALASLEPERRAASGTPSAPSVLAGSCMTRSRIPRRPPHFG